MQLTPIGRIATPWATVAACPRNGRQPQPPPVCRVTIDPPFRDGLECLDGFSHLILLYWLHATRPGALVFTPPFDDAPRGIFATRAPFRPNPIGLAVVALDGIADGCLSVRYLDCVDGTPLLGVKPYLPSTDALPDATVGWLARHIR